MKQLIYPNRGDPRWFILLFLGSLMLYATFSPGFSRTPVQLAVAVLVCVGLDSALLLRRGLLLAPLSGLITSGGTLLLCDSPAVWPYALVAALSILSKHFIRVAGRHLYNPNNFGIVVAMLFFSGELTVVAGRWGGDLGGMLAISALGVLAAWRAGRLALAVAYVMSFIAGAALRHAWAGAPYSVLLAPMTGAAFQLFTFYMITDPMTTPTNARERLWFAVTLGLLDSLMRHLQIHKSPFYALFILHSLMPLLRVYRRSEESVWKTSSLTWGR